MYSLNMRMATLTCTAVLGSDNTLQAVTSIIEHNLLRCTSQSLDTATTGEQNDTTSIIEHNLPHCTRQSLDTATTGEQNDTITYALIIVSYMHMTNDSDHSRQTN